MHDAAASVILGAAQASLGYATRRFVTCTESGAAVRSTVEALTFRAVTRTLLFDQTWQSRTKAMLLVSS